MIETLPEGTDHIIPGATSTTPDSFEEDAAFGRDEQGRKGEASPGSAGSATDPAALRDRLADVREKVTSRASDAWSKYQVNDKAMEFAESGKARATGALDEVARMIGETAGKIDEQIGAGYGDYVRRAADAVSSTSTTLRDKPVDELVEDAREIVRKSPGIALGAAAMAGLALARILKAGSEALDAAAKQTASDAPSRGEDTDSNKGKHGKKSRKSKSDRDA